MYYHWGLWGCVASLAESDKVLASKLCLRQESNFNNWENQMIAVQLTNGSIEMEFATYLPVLEVLHEIANLIKEGDRARHLDERLQGFEILDSIEVAIILTVPGPFYDPLKTGTVAIRFKHGTEYYTCQQIQAMFAPEPEPEPEPRAVPYMEPDREQELESESEPGMWE